MWFVFICNHEIWIHFGFFHISSIFPQENTFVRHAKAILRWQWKKKVNTVVWYWCVWFLVGIHNVMLSLYSKPSYSNLAEIPVREMIVCSLHIIGTGNGIALFFLLSQSLSSFEQAEQMICGAQLLSWSPIEHPQYNCQTFLISIVMPRCWALVGDEPQTYNVSGLLLQCLDILNRAWWWGWSWWDTIMSVQKMIGDTFCDKCLIQPSKIKMKTIILYNAHSWL